MTPRAAVYQMIADTDAGLECAHAIADHEHWRCDDEAARKRVAQCIRGTAGRHFCLDWYPIVLRVVIAHGGVDLVEPILAETRYQARREAEAEPERAKVHRVTPRNAADRRRA